MKLSEALPIAERIKSQLSRVSSRCEIAGSIRRKKTHVKDIEIVCIPHEDAANGNLFGLGESLVRSHTWCDAVRKLGKLRKGQIVTGKYLQLNLPDGINLDLFVARPENWGLIYAIRTGSADFSHQILARGWVRNGYKSIDGMIVSNYDGAAVPMREEEDLFRLIDAKCVAPELREWNAEKRQWCVK